MRNRFVYTIAGALALTLGLVAALELTEAPTLEAARSPISGTWQGIDPPPPVGDSSNVTIRIRETGRGFRIFLFDDQGAICGEAGPQPSDPPLIALGHATADAGDPNVLGGQYGFILCFGEGPHPATPIPLTFTYLPDTDQLDIGLPGASLFERQ
jgi:hypothetical protein